VISQLQCIKADIERQCRVHVVCSPLKPVVLYAAVSAAVCWRMSSRYARIVSLQRKKYPIRFVQIPRVVLETCGGGRVEPQPPPRGLAPECSNFMVTNTGSRNVAEMLSPAFPVWVIAVFYEYSISKVQMSKQSRRKERSSLRRREHHDVQVCRSTSVH